MRLRMRTEIYGNLASFKVEQGDIQESQWELVVLISKRYSISNQIATVSATSPFPPITLSYSPDFSPFVQFS